MAFGRTDSHHYSFGDVHASLKSVGFHPHACKVNVLGEIIKHQALDTRLASHKSPLESERNAA